MVHADDDDDEDDHDVADEQDLLVVLKLSNRMMGTAHERQELADFAESLGAAVAEAGVGDYDGDEWGGGECVLFFCGPDLDRLRAVLRPLLKRSPLARGGHFVHMAADGDGGLQRVRQPI